jgi:hypothetical protein
MSGQKILNVPKCSSRPSFQKNIYMKLDVKKVTQSFSSTFSTEDSQALVILAHCLGLQVDHAEAPDP